LGRAQPLLVGARALPLLLVEVLVQLLQGQVWQALLPAAHPPPPVP